MGRLKENPNHEKKLIIPVERWVWERLRFLALQNNTSVCAMMRQSAEKILRHHGKHIDQQKINDTMLP